MPENWKTYNWGNLATLEYGKGLRDYRRNQGNYRVYGTNGAIGWHSEALCKHAGIVIGRKGAYRGVHYSNEPFYVIDTAFYLKPKQNIEIDLKWAYYELLTKDINGMDSGSAIPSTTRESFYQLPVKVPPIEEQRRIAEILSALDEKIELNLEMNRTLERIAQAMFKHWFVDFKFPGFGGELINGLPEGWRETDLDEIVDLIIDHRGKTPLKLGGVWKEEGIPAISAKNVKDKKLINLDNVGYIDENLYAKWMKEELKPFDILLTSEAPLGEIAILISNTKYCLSQRLFAIRTNSKCNPIYLFYYLLSPQGSSNLQKRATGSTVSGIRQSELWKFEVLLPPIQIQNSFGDVVGLMRERIDENENEIKTLTQIRDSLLPKLMSGKIRVAE
jgi:type I restriction enzyme S subunit